MDTKPTYAMVNFGEFGGLVIDKALLPMALPPGTMDICQDGPVGGVIVSMLDTEGHKSFIIMTCEGIEELAQDLMGAAAVARKLVQDYLDREIRESN